MGAIGGKTFDLEESYNLSCSHASETRDRFEEDGDIYHEWLFTGIVTVKFCRLPLKCV